ncbi:class F sortase [Dictyobacter vulcani]|uniref:class F sortase n=1 Tax=Dictyobacter vulcani TaxID=2607529 RepID=UPI001E5EC3C0|nr:class F sortase [Dictyobacter vulcani]
MHRSEHYDACQSHRDVSIRKVLSPVRTSRLSLVFMSICLLFVLSACGDNSTSTARTTPTLPTATQTPASKATPTPASTTQTSVSITDPVHIKIPAINVDTDIEPVGVLPSGNMDTPQHNPWDGTGWYNSGTRPGELGSAVIDGHVDRPGGGPAIFWNLRNMKPGDKVLITTRSGQHLSFHTTKSEAIPPDKATSRASLATAAATTSTLSPAPASGSPAKTRPPSAWSSTPNSTRSGSPRGCNLFPHEYLPIVPAAFTAATSPLTSSMHLIIRCMEDVKSIFINIAYA